MSNYRYKENSSIDWAYNSTESVIHFKFGDMRKMYFFTKKFKTDHPKFCKEYEKYFMGQKSLFSDPLAILNYIDTYKIPVRLYSNYVDEEFADIDAAREWLCQEYQGQNSWDDREKLYNYKTGIGYTGLDGERSE